MTNGDRLFTRNRSSQQSFVLLLVLVYSERDIHFFPFSSDFGLWKSLIMCSCSCSCSSVKVKSKNHEWTLWACRYVELWFENTKDERQGAKKLIFSFFCGKNCTHTKNEFKIGEVICAGVSVCMFLGSEYVMYACLLFR